MGSWVTLVRQEGRRALQHFGLAEEAPAEPHEDEQELKVAKCALNVELKREEIQKTIPDEDDDDSGLVGYEEFLEMMTRKILNCDPKDNGGAAVVDGLELQKNAAAGCQSLREGIGAAAPRRPARSGCREAAGSG